MRVPAQQSRGQGRAQLTCRAPVDVKVRIIPARLIDVNETLHGLDQGRRVLPEQQPNFRVLLQQVHQVHRHAKDEEEGGTPRDIVQV